jgi:metal-dependent amidase/aminoacylase/carboxypeptidase family protein
MSDDLKKEIYAIEEEVITLRREFHQHPELGLKENRTSRIIADYLEKTGIAVTTIIPYLILMRPAW